MPMRFNLAGTLLLSSLLAVGCARGDQETIRVQQVPKQPPPGQTQQPSAPINAMAQAVPDAPSGNASEVQWTVPQGWKELPGAGMRVASFQVSAEHPEVQLSVIPLVASPLLANVNRWEQQMGLPATPEADLGKVVTHFEVSGAAVDMVDLTSPATVNPRQELLGAIVPRGEKTWFFKLQGPVEIVGPQKQNFEALLRSMKFNAAAAGQAQPQAAAPAGEAQTQLPPGHPALPAPAQPPQPQLPAGHPQLPGGMDMGNAQPIAFKYTAPPGWTKDAEMPMRVVSFHLGEADKQADIIVSALPTNAGSRIDNINRWRSQVGLPLIKEGDPQLSQPIKVGGVEGALFDLIGPGDRAKARHMLVAWIPNGNDWWFFKMIGPDEVVTREQANFENFLKSVQFATEKP
jgi:hypothetical protein